MAILWCPKRRTAVWLCSGDTLVFYTDGFSEAKNEHGEEVWRSTTSEHLEVAIQQTYLAEVVQAICKDVQRFIGYAPQYDDMTMVVVKIG